MNNTIVAIILNWNAIEQTRRCIASLQQSRDVNLHLVVLDNGSTRNEAAVLQKEYDEKITIWRSERNLGFTGGVNMVMMHIQENIPDIRAFVLVNQDVTVEPNCLATLWHALQHHPRAAAVGPLLTDEHGTILSAGARVNFWTGKVIAQLSRPQEPILPVEVLSGACLMLRKESIEAIGVFDDRYFAYYEEVDWCLRARRQDLQCLVVAAARAAHHRTHAFRTYFIVRNMIWLEREWGNRLQCGFFLLYLFLVFFPERLHKGSSPRVFLRAVWHGLKYRHHRDTV